MKKWFRYHCHYHYHYHCQHLQFWNQCPFSVFRPTVFLRQVMRKRKTGALGWELGFVRDPGRGPPLTPKLLPYGSAPLGPLSPTHTPRASAPPTLIPGAALRSSPAVINRLHLLSPLGGFVAQFPPNCSISGFKNQGEHIITAVVLQVTAPTVENRHDILWQEYRFGWGAGVLGRARLGYAAGRWGSDFLTQRLQDTLRAPIRRQEAPR